MPTGNASYIVAKQGVDLILSDNWNPKEHKWVKVFKVRFERIGTGNRKLQIPYLQSTYRTSNQDLPYHNARNTVPPIKTYRTATQGIPYLQSTAVSIILLLSICDRSSLAAIHS